MNVLVTGCQSIAKYPNLQSRRFSKNPVAATTAIIEYEAVKAAIHEELDFLHEVGGFPIDTLISPSGDGTDQAVEEWASLRSIKVKRFKPKWFTGGEVDRRAGFDAISKMVLAADAAILFGNSGDKSTLRIKRMMTGAKKPVYYVDWTTRS